MNISVVRPYDSSRKFLKTWNSLNLSSPLVDHVLSIDTLTYARMLSSRFTPSIANLYISYQMHQSSCTHSSLPKLIRRVKGTRSSFSRTVQCRKRWNMSWASTIQFQAWTRRFKWALLRSSDRTARVTQHIEYAALLSPSAPFNTPFNTDTLDSLYPGIAERVISCG